MSSRFSSLKTKPKNTFKSDSGKSRPSFNGDSNKGFETSYKSDLDSVFSTNKKNKYIPPAMRDRRSSSSSFSRNSSQRTPAFKPIQTFKEKKGDFPSLGEDPFPALGATEQENDNSRKVSFANLVKNKEKLVEEKKEEIDAVKPGWIRWRKDPHTNKWIVERGPPSKEHRRFMKWMNEFKEYRKRVAFEEYLDRLEQQEYEDFLLNGPTYVQAWEIVDEPNYDSDPNAEEDILSDSDEHEYIDENDFY